MSADQLQPALTAWIAEEIGDPDVRVSGLHRTSAGFSRENWTFSAAWSGNGGMQQQPLILRRDPPGSVLNTDRRVETEVLRALQQTSVPSPPLRWADTDGVRLGRPSIIMDLVPGSCDGFALAADAPVAQRLALAEQLYDHLADIHLLDWQLLGLGDVLDDPGKGAAEAAVVHWESELRSVQLSAEPELELALHWLRTHAPVSERTVLVHGDFKAGNVLLARGADGVPRVTAVLDWETAHLGDPHEDLGWVTNPLRAREHTIPGAWEAGDLIDRWSKRTGWSADADAVHWWRVLANVKLTVIVLSGIRAFVEGRLDRVYQPPITLYALLLRQIGA